MFLLISEKLGTTLFLPSNKVKLKNSITYRIGRPSAFEAQRIVPNFFVAFFMFNFSIFSIFSNFFYFFNFFQINRFFQKKEHLLKKQKYFGGAGIEPAPFRLQNIALSTAR